MSDVKELDLKARMRLTLNRYFDNGQWWFDVPGTRVDVVDTFREALDRILELESEVKRLEEKASAADAHRMEMIRWAAAEASS